MDRVIYSMGVSLDRLGRRNEGGPMYLRLVRDHSASRYVALTYLAFGDQLHSLGTAFCIAFNPLR